MFLRVPAMNRSLNRENPDILIMMIAGKQKRDQIREREGEDGPSKACNSNECHCTKHSSPLLSCLFSLFYLSLLIFGFFFHFPFNFNTGASPTPFLTWTLNKHFLPFHGFLLQLLVLNVQRLDNIIWQRRESWWGLRKWNSCFGVGMLEEDVSVHAKVVNTTLVLLFYLAWCKQGWNALASFPCWFFL